MDSRLASALSWFIARANLSPVPNEALSARGGPGGWLQQTHGFASRGFDGVEYVVAHHAVLLYRAKQKVGT